MCRPVGVGAYFVLAAIGFISATCCNVVLTWDGASYLFNVLDLQRPYTPNNRLINWPLHLPVLLASRFTDSLPFLQLVFGLTYAAIPLAMLAASWWVVREDARPLFVWAALGIGIGLLPGQINLVSEANLAVLFAWPMILALLVGLRRKHLPLVIALIVALYVTHPLAALFYLFAAGIAILKGWREPLSRRRFWGWAAGFTVLAASSAVGFLLFRSSYERDQTSFGVLGGAFTSAIAGLPLVGLLAGGLAAYILIASPWLRLRRRAMADIALGLAIVCLLVAIVAFVLWAQDASKWRLALVYSRWVVFVAIAFLLPAAIEGIGHGPALRERLMAAWPGRSAIVQLVAAGSTVVLIVQSLTWLNLNVRLNEVVAASSWSCVSAGAVSWIPGTPLDHWSLAERVVLQEGRNPKQIMLDGDLCGATDFSAGIPLDPTIAPAVLHSWTRGWFNFAAVRDGLSAESQGVAGCSYMLTTGWYMTESNGRFWWRWSDGRAPQIRVVLDRAATVQLGGQFETAQAPNSIAIAVNGQALANVTITTQGQQPIQGLALPLKAGANTIQLTSQNPPTPFSVGSRQLAIAVDNLTMSIVDGGQACHFHP